MKKLFTIGVQDALVLLGFYSLIFLQMDNLALDPGVGWHLQTGKDIWHSFSIPGFDTFLHSDVPRRWVSDQWLGDVVLYLLYSIGWWPLLYASCTILFAGTFLFLLYRMTERFSSACLATSLAVLLAFKGGQIHYIIRPVLFGFFFFVLVFERCETIHTLLTEYGKKREYLERRGRDIAWFALIFLLWSNMHPSFVLGLALVGSLFLGACLDRMVFYRDVALPDLHYLGSLLLVSLFATLANPNSIELHLSILELARSDYFMNFHMEWLPVDFRTFEGWIVELFILVPVLSLVFVGPVKPRLRSYQVLVLLLFAHLVVRSIRILPFFGIVFAIVFARSCVQTGKLKFFSETWVVQRLALAFQRLELRERNTCKGESVFLLCSAVLLFSAVAFHRIPFYQAGYGPSPTLFPYKATQYLVEREQSAVVASVPRWGGFLVWFGDGKISPIIDDRNGLLGEEFYKAYLAAFKNYDTAIAHARSLGSRYLLLPKEHELVASAQEHPENIVFSDEVSVLVKLPQGGFAEQHGTV